MVKKLHLNENFCSDIINLGATVFNDEQAVSHSRKGVVVMEIVFVISAIVTIVTGVFYIYDVIRKHFQNHNKK